MVGEDFLLTFHFHHKAIYLYSKVTNSHFLIQYFFNSFSISSWNTSNSYNIRHMKGYYLPQFHRLHCHLLQRAWSIALLLFTWTIFRFATFHPMLHIVLFLQMYRSCFRIAAVCRQVTRLITYIIFNYITSIIFGSFSYTFLLAIEEPFEFAWW